MKTKTALSSSTKQWITINTINGLANSLSSLFVNVYLYQLSQNFYQVAWFNFVAYLVWLPIFVLAGWLSKKVNSKIGLLIGGSIQVLFYLAVLILGTHSIDNIFILGIVYGIGSGFYWLSNNVLSVDVTESSNRDWFNGINGMLGSVTQIIGPFVAGMIVKHANAFTGYQVLFFLTFLLFFVSMILTWRLPVPKETGGFSWRTLWHVHREKEWFRLDVVFFGLSFRDGVLSFAIWLWVFMITKNATDVGNFAAITTALSVVVYYIIGRYTNDKRRTSFFVAGTCLLSVSLLSLVYVVNWYTLVFYSFASAICNPFIQAPFSTIVFNSISNFDRDGNKRIELVVAREIVLSVGRITSVGCLAFLYDHHYTTSLFRWFMLLLIGVGCFPVLFMKNRSQKQQKTLRSIA